MVEQCYEDAVKDTENDSLVKRLEEYRAKHGESMPLAMAEGVCGTAFAAAAEATRTTLCAFFLLMREHPMIQRKALAEITRVLGHNRLPEFSDRESLPYVQALYLEVMRWMPAAPFAFPHSSVSDDIYQGYFIPKGSVVIGNVWAMLNDEAKYPNPRVFNPERFLDADGDLTDDTDVRAILAFGFGRRVCAGRHFADALLWRVMASVIAAFDIGQPKGGEENAKVDLDDFFDQGIISHVAPFKCSIVPRTEEMAKVIATQIL